MPEPKKDKKPISMTSVIIWCIVGGVGAYYLLNGLIGIVGKS